MRITSLAAIVCLGLFGTSLATAAEKPNVLLIVCDDLNDYIESLGGHPQAQTPNIERLSKSGVSFKQAHCNIPICAPSRSSFLTGLYPHTSRNFGFDRWDQNEVLQSSRKISRVGQGPWKHFDVVRDIGEGHDVSGGHPERLQEMVSQTEKWSRSHTQPKWFHDLKTRDTWNQTGMPNYDETFKID